MGFFLASFFCAAAHLRFGTRAVIVCFRDSRPLLFGAPDSPLRGTSCHYHFLLLRFCFSASPLLSFWPPASLRASQLFGKCQEHAAAGSLSHGAPRCLAPRVRERPQAVKMHQATNNENERRKDRQKERKKERKKKERKKY